MVTVPPWKIVRVLLKEQLIARAKAVLATRQENGSDETLPEEVVKWADANAILQQQTPISEALRDKLRAFI
jgi:hypothetical protein